MLLREDTVLLNLLPRLFKTEYEAACMHMLTHCMQSCSSAL